MLFKKGFKAVNEEKERQEKNAENMRKGLWRFFLGKDGDESDIVFLTEEPINFYEHTIKVNRNGKEMYDNIPCSGSDCKHCADGNKPSFKSAWLIVDRREYEYTDSNKKKQVGKDQIRLFVYGTRIASQLDRYHTKYGLVGTLYTMARTGKDKQTAYIFERGDKFEFTSKEIEQLLSESLRNEYDGTMESLYTLVENQIKMLIEDETPLDEDIEEDEDLEEEEDDLVSLDDEEEIEKPKTKVKMKKKGMFKSKKQIENQVKPSIKSIIKKKK